MYSKFIFLYYENNKQFNHNKINYVKKKNKLDYYDKLLKILNENVLLL